MMRNRVGYFIKEGVNSIFAHGFMSFASVFIIMACLIIMGSFSLLAFNIDHIIRNLEQQNQVAAYIDEQLSIEQARSLESQIDSLPNVADAQFISRDEAMDSFLSQYENNRLFDDIDASTFRHRYIITLHRIEDMQETQNELINITGIAKVRAHLDIAQGFVTLRNVVGIVSVALVFILLIVSIFIMANTVKLTTFNRREEIAIMRMVGATNSFIRMPFVVEGLILGMLGSMLAYLIEWALYYLISSGLSGSGGLSFITLMPFSRVSLPLLIAYLSVGVIVGVGGSISTIKNYLKV